MGRIYMADFEKNNIEQPYLNGSVAPKMIPLPKKTETPRKPNTQTRQNQSQEFAKQKKSQSIVQMDFSFLFILTIATVISLAFCVTYLQKQIDISKRMKNVITYELDYITLKSQNDAFATSIDTSVDLEYIYKVATEKLGMIYANKDQVILFEKPESEYVNQNEDIPR